MDEHPDPARPDPDRPEDAEVVEPEHGTEDDWFGQRVDRDTELAEDLAEETDDEADAARRFEAEKEGPRPEDLPTEERP